MTPLAWFLASVLVASAIWLLVGVRLPNFGRQNATRRFKYVVSTYALVIAVVLGLMSYWFIGGALGSPRIPRNLQRRIEHSGYYFARDGELKLVGDSSSPTVERQPNPSQALTVEEEKTQENDVIRQLMPADSPEPGSPLPSGGSVLEHGFIHRALGAGALLTLRPEWNSDKAAEWTLTYKINDRPLRLESTENKTIVSRCVNVPPERWLNKGDTIFITREREGEERFVSIKWDVGTKYWWPFTRDTNAYYFGEGAIHNGVPVYEKEPMLMSERILVDGLPLDSLVRHAKKEFRTQVGTIDQEWWSIFESIALVREERGNRRSQIGLLIEDDLVHKPGVGIVKNIGAGNAQRMDRNATQPATIRIPSSTVVAYGFRGVQNSFALRLTEEVFPDDEWRQVMRVTFVHPQVWRVPPEPNKDFIVTSTNDYIPLDGYVFDIGNSPHSFYAKARLGDELDDLYINDGRNVVNDLKETGGEAGASRRFRLDEAASLGDYDQGVLLKLVRSQSVERTDRRLALIFGSLSDTGRVSILLIALNAVAFIILSFRQKYHRPKLFLGWTMIWGATLTLLVVRLVLIFRVSLIPPFDASAAEVRGIFDKGVDYALLGLLAFAGLSFSLIFAGRASRRSTWSPLIAALAVIFWGFVLSTYTAIGAYAGSDQSFGLRISIADHVLIAIGLAVLARPVLGSQSNIPKALIVVVIVLMLTLQIFVVKDAGSIIYACSLVFVAALILGWKRPGGALRNWALGFIARRARWLRNPLRRLTRGFPATALRGLKSLANWLVPVAIASSPLAILVFSPYLVQPGAIRKVVQPAIPDTAFYRFASFTDAEDVIVTAKSGEEDTDMSKLLDNSRQNWQTLLYASQGSHAPVGYGRAPLSKIGMTYGTSVSDCAFASYVLAEHGNIAAILLLLLYILIACACVLSGWHLDITARARNIPLVAIGGFFAYNALYMGGANVGLFVFTGQNVPLLGLNSGGDLMQGLALTWIAGWLLLRTTQEGTVRSSWRDRPVIIRWGTGLCVGAMLLLLAIGIRTSYIGGEDRYRQDHDLKPEIFKKIIRDLPVEDTAANHGNEPLLLVGDKLERPEGASLTEIEEQYRKQFNDRTDKFNPNGGLFYLNRTHRLGARSKLHIKVNQRFFFARSPFGDPAVWRGEIVAGGQSDPTLYALNARLNVSIQASGYPGSIDLSKAQGVRTTFSVLLREGRRQFCELTRDRDGDRLRLVPKKGDWDLFVDGRRVADAIDLEPLAIIVIEGRDPKYRRNLIYLGAIRPVLAYVRWRNGERRRMFPEGSLSLAYFLGKAADQIEITQAKLPSEERRLGSQLALTVDVGLQQTLQQYLLHYAGLHANYSPFLENPNRLAVTVLDAFSGQVLALPSWPVLDLSKREYEKLVDKISEPTRSRFEDNGNLTKHVVGSTIKPVVLATMASALWPTRDLEGLRVYNRTNTYASRSASERTIHPHRRVGGIDVELWDCNSTQPVADMKSFIIHSLDYPEGILGMLGMVDNTQELTRVLRRNEKAPDVSFGGTDYTLDLTKASENATAFSIQDQREGRLPFPRGKEAVNNTLLYRGLSSLFDFGCSDPPDVRLQRSLETFFPTFHNPNLPLSSNGYIDNVIPTRLDMAGGDFQGIRQGFLSCLLGGEPCGFNNVMMAESAARLAIGQRIFAKLEDSPPNDSVTLANPLGDAAWRNRNIIDPMQMVGQTGTASPFRTSKDGRVRFPAPYKAIFKTGTMVEGDEGRESEALMFVIGRWENSSFVRGETLAGFLYMEKSKFKNPPGMKVPDGDMKKFAFAAPLLHKIVTYLEAGRRIH